MKHEVVSAGQVPWQGDFQNVAADFKERYYGGDESRVLEGLRTLVNGSGDKTKVEDGYKAILLLTLLTAPRSSLLKEPYEFLIGELCGSVEEQEQDLLRTLRAVMVSDAIVHQNSLPFSKRGIARLTLRKEGLLSLGQIVEVDKLNSEVASLESLLAFRIESFLQRLERVLTKIPDSLDEKNRQTLFIDAVWKTGEEPIFPVWNENGSPIAKRIYNMTTSSLNRRLLREFVEERGLDGIESLGFKSFLWFESWHDRDLFVLSGEDPFYQKLAGIFFVGPEIQRIYWESLSFKGSDFDLKGASKERLDSLISVNNLSRHYRSMEWFLLGESETLGRFLGTCGLEMLDSREKERALRRLIGIFAVFKTVFPHHPNSQALGKFITDVAERSGKPGSFSQEAKILGDEADGVIYKNVNNEARARLPGSGQSKDGLLSALKKEGTIVLFVSPSGWLEPSTSVDKIKSCERLEGGIVETTSSWGKIYLPSCQELALLLPELNTGISDIKAEGLFALLTQYYNNASPPSEAELVLAPELLQNDHPLARLISTKLLAVELKDGEGLFVFDEVGGFALPGDARLGLKGKLSEGGELTIKDAPGDFEYSPLHLLFNCACIFLRQRYLVCELNRDEISEARRCVRWWNQLSKKRGFAQVAFDPAQKANSNARLLLQLGGKAVHLTFAS